MSVIGSNSIGPDVEAPTSDVVIGGILVIPAGGGTINDIVFYGRALTSGNYRFNIYNVTSNNPTTTVYTTGNIAVNTTLGWKTTSPNQAISAGTYYFAISFDEDYELYSDLSTPAQFFAHWGQTPLTFESPVDTGTNYYQANDRTLSLYINFTAAGAADTTKFFFLH